MSLVHSLPSLRYVFLTTREDDVSFDKDTDSLILEGNWNVSRGWRVGELAGGSERVQGRGPGLVELHEDVMETIIWKEGLILSDTEVSTALHCTACRNPLHDRGFCLCSCRYCRRGVRPENSSKRVLLFRKISGNGRYLPLTSEFCATGAANLQCALQTRLTGAFAARPLAPWEYLQSIAPAPTTLRTLSLSSTIYHRMIEFYSQSFLFILITSRVTWASAPEFFETSLGRRSRQVRLR